MTVELVGDPLDGDLHFRYLGVVKGLSVAIEELLRVDILEDIKMPFMLRAGTFRLMFQRVLDLSIVIFRCRKAAFVLVVDHSGQLWQSEHVVLEKYTSDVV